MKSMKPKICCLFNYNPLYRQPIYKAMDEAFDCDFFFADAADASIRQFPPETLKGFRGRLHAVTTRFKGYVWYRGVGCIFRRRYTHYIVTGENLIIADWLLMVWCRLTGARLLYWTHGEHEHHAKPSTHRVLSAFYRGAHTLLTYGSSCWPYMVALGCKEERMKAIHNSLDTSVQSRLYAQLKPSEVYRDHFGNALPVVIYIGRLQQRKKVGQLIDAARLLRDQGRAVNVVLVGDEADATGLHEQVAAEGMERFVWFYGPSYDEARNAQLLYDARVCVCPAAVGLTAIHALSYGCPVVSNDNFETQMPEHEAVVDGVTGSFFHEDDVADLAEKMSHWCGLSAEAREATRRAARQTVEREWSVSYQLEVLRSCL